MEQKNKFLEKALALFLENGAKTLTMDDIAREFGMSKRTIYQHYKNKEELLDSVLDFHTDMVISKLKAITEIENLNSVEKMLIRDEDLQKLSNNQKSIFIRQVKKYYSNLSKKNAIKAYEKLKTIFISNIEQGQKEGLYRKNIDVEVVVGRVGIPEAHIDLAAGVEGAEERLVVASEAIHIDAHLDGEARELDDRQAHSLSLVVLTLVGTEDRRRGDGHRLEPVDIGISTLDDGERAPLRREAEGYSVLLPALALLCGQGLELHRQRIREDGARLDDDLRAGDRHLRCGQQRVAGLIALVVLIQGLLAQLERVALVTRLHVGETYVEVDARAILTEGDRADASRLRRRLGDVGSVGLTAQLRILTGGEERRASCKGQQRILDLHTCCAWLLNNRVHQLDSTTPPGVGKPLDGRHVDTIDDVGGLDAVLEVDAEGTDTALTIGDAIDDGVLQGEG